jgi:response regulator RpfG family c-di-GMP phosphodiesterase
MIKALVVDDEPQACDAMRTYLTGRGLQAYTAPNGEEALSFIAEHAPEVTLLDLRMPVMNGLEALKRIKKTSYDGEVIVVTAVSDLKVALECVRNGAFGYILKPVNFDSLGVEIDKALERRRLTLENRDYQKNLEKKVAEKTTEVRALLARQENSFYQTINMFVDLMGMYDPFASGHAKRVAVLADMTAKAMGLSVKECEDIEIAGLLHDLGRMGMPERVREEPLDRLTDDELAKLTDQTLFAQRLLKIIDRLDVPGVIIRSHLERFDGKGFPDGLKGTEIPLPSRILAVANAYDEVRNRRRFSGEQFMKTMSDDTLAISALQQGGGKQFDKLVVRAFLETLHELKIKQKNAYTVTLRQLKEGLVLAENIVAENGKLLLAEGNKLSVVQIAKIWNYHKETSPIPEPISVYGKRPPEGGAAAGGGGV